MSFSLDHHVETLVTLFGVVLDLLGALYLAYDLLGRKEGFLRVLTEVIAYVAVLLFFASGGMAIGFAIVVGYDFRILARAFLNLGSGVGCP
jgi:hypothetical protein